MSGISQAEDMLSSYHSTMNDDQKSLEEKKNQIEDIPWCWMPDNARAIELAEEISSAQEDPQISE